MLTLARLQQLSTVAMAGVAVAAAAVLVRQGEPLWAVASFGLVVLGYALVLAIEFALLAVANRNDPAPAATTGHLVRAWWGEVLTAPQVFCWSQPFRSRAHPDWLPRAPSGQGGIVFVHGFVCNRGLWNPWLARLRRLGIPYIAVDLAPVFGSIDDYAGIIDQAVFRMEASTAVRPLIVAHSMGGLAVRAWLAARDADSRVRHIITIGTPHAGTRLAGLALTMNARQMRMRSVWLEALSHRERDGRFAQFTCFYSHCDNVVFPASTATLSGADNRHVPGVAHVHLTRQESVFQEILRRAADLPEPATPTFAKAG